MRSRVRLALLIASLGASSACDCGSTLTAVGSTDLVIVTPTPDQDIGSGQTIDFKATASNPIGIVSLSLYGGTETTTACQAVSDCSGGQVCDENHLCIATALNICKPASATTAMACENMLALSKAEPLIVDGQINLTAVAVDHKQTVSVKTVAVDVKALTIQFTRPVITPGTSPAVADVSGTGVVAVSLTTALPLSKVVITYDNNSPLMSWGGNPTATTFQKTIDWDTTLTVGMHRLLATATDTSGNTNSATLEVNVGMLSIAFTAPVASGGGNPPVASVTAAGPVSVKVSSPAKLTKVIITYDSGSTLASWTTNPIGPTFTQTIDWLTTPGNGLHELTATASAVDGEVAIAKLNVMVGTPACTSDSDCTNGERCCTQDGLCHPTVAENADCDCSHPCPTDQGCFPGVCGAVSQKCRPGCYPGSDSPAPYGTAPAACSPQPGGPNNTMLPAYCNPLPPGEATAANQGGACAVGDNCDPIGQTGCGMLPLDRTQPESATNPLVAYNCIPMAPGVNGCVPAGNIPAGGINCNQNVQPGVSGTVCGVTAGNCATGSVCVVEVDQNGNALGPPTCDQECKTPTMNPCNSSGCASGSYCDTTFGLGMVNFTVGSCASNMMDPLCSL